MSCTLRVHPINLGVVIQTFLPLPDPAASAKILDRQRLGKQRVENLQILKALTDPNYGWKNHPAVKMWIGFEPWFRKYHHAICAEWTGRGYKDTCLEKFDAIYMQHFWYLTERTPDFIGNTEFHLSHQSNLVRKSESIYGPHFPTVPNNLDYVWPVTAGVV